MSLVTLDKAALAARAKTAQASYVKQKTNKKKKSVLETLDNAKIVIQTPPTFTDTQRHNQRIAAGKYALAYNADPFAHARIMLHMQMGYEESASVMAHADAVLAARSSQHASERA